MRSRKDRVDEDAKNNELLTNRPGAYDAIRNQLQKREEALRKARKKLAAAMSDLESLHCNTKDVEKELLVT